MDNNHWLRAEIAQWLREGLISDELAQQLYLRYPALSRDLSGDGNWGKMIFAAIGAIVFGLGVILFFAYNWAEMHRYTKLGVIAGSQLLSVALAVWLRSTKRESRLAESLFLLGTMLFGSGLLLTAQIYHADLDYPRVFLGWSLLALGFAWALPSIAQGILAALLLVIWVGMESLEWQRLQLWGGLLALLGLAPLAYRLRSPVLMAACLLAAPVCLLFNGHALGQGWLVVHAVLLLGAYLSVERLLPLVPAPRSLAPLYPLALAGWLLGQLLLSSGDFANRLQPEVAGNEINWLIYGVLVLAVLGAQVTGFYLPMLRPQNRQQGVEWLLLGLPLITVALLPVLTVPADLLRVLANLSVLGFGFLLVYRGTEQVNLRTLLAGCATVAVLCFLRFHDLFQSLLARSSVFLILGLLLLLVGLRFSRQSERRKLERPHA